MFRMALQVHRRERWNKTSLATICHPLSCTLHLLFPSHLLFHEDLKQRRWCHGQLPPSQTLKESAWSFLYGYASRRIPGWCIYRLFFCFEWFQWFGRWKFLLYPDIFRRLRHPLYFLRYLLRYFAFLLLLFVFFYSLELLIRRISVTKIKHTILRQYYQ